VITRRAAAPLGNQNENSNTARPTTIEHESFTTTPEEIACYNTTMKIMATNKNNIYKTIFWVTTINWNNEKPYMASTRSVKSNELYFFALIQ
jgi:hypothetical protein